VAYSLFDDVSAWVKRLLGSKRVIDKGESELEPISHAEDHPLTPAADDDVSAAG
jgi:hypothetical protein